MISSASCGGSPLNPSRRRDRNMLRFMRPSENLCDSAFEIFPFGPLRCQRGMSFRRKLIIFSGWTISGFPQIGPDQGIALYTAHQGIDRAFAHPDVVGHTARNFIRVTVAAREQCKYAKLQ